MIIINYNNYNYNNYNYNNYNYNNYNNHNLGKMVPLTRFGIGLS